MKNPASLTYGIAGLGLMGGSIAKSIRENVLSVASASGKIFAWDKNESSLSLAENQGVIDGKFSAEDADKMISRCDMVFVCLYPHATKEFLVQHKNSFKSGAIVTDISGVKAEIFSSLNEILRDDVDFILGHPMAGSEREGFASSGGVVFKNHNYIIMPVEKNRAENLEFFKFLVSSMGFGRIVETSAKIHDHKIAFTSQLCHVIASALVDSAEDLRVTSFGGGSFEDLTRIAMINAPLWTELFLANGAELLSHMEKFESSFARLKKMIQDGDADSLEKFLFGVREKRISMGSVEVKE